METNFNPTPTEEGKPAAIIAYISIIGWLISYFAIHKDKKTELASFHLRQTLLLYLAGFVLQIAQRIFWAIAPFSALNTLFNIVYLGLFILWVIGLIGAIQGVKKEIPLIGKPAQTMFPSI